MEKCRTIKKKIETDKSLCVSDVSQRIRTDMSENSREGNLSPKGDGTRKTGLDGGKPTLEFKL